jgi:hypothetical protein
MYVSAEMAQVLIVYIHCKSITGDTYENKVFIHISFAPLTIKQ